MQKQVLSLNFLIRTFGGDLQGFGHRDVASDCTRRYFCYLLRDLLNFSMLTQPTDIVDEFALIELTFDHQLVQ